MCIRDSPTPQKLTEQMETLTRARLWLFNEEDVCQTELMAMTGDTKDENITNSTDCCY